MEFGTQQHINSSYGTLYFNMPGCGIGLPNFCMFMLQNVEGVVSAQVRPTTEDKPNKEGGIAHAFFKGAKYIDFDCLIIADTPAHRTTMRDWMLGVLSPLLASDGTYFWNVPTADFPGVGEWRSNTVRLFEAPEIRDPEGGVAGPKHATWQLIAYGVPGEDGFADMVA